MNIIKESNNTIINKKFIINPFKSLGPLLLGMTKSESRHIMKEIYGLSYETFSRWEGVPPLDMYYESSLQIHFDSSDKIKCIELVDKPIFMIFSNYEIEVTKLTVDEFMKLIKKEFNLDFKIDLGAGICYGLGLVTSIDEIEDLVDGVLIGTKEYMTEY